MYNVWTNNSTYILRLLFQYYILDYYSDKYSLNTFYALTLANNNFSLDKVTFAIMRVSKLFRKINVRHLI